MKTNMNRFVSLVLFSFLLILPAMAANKKGQKTTTFRVEMDCQGCVKTIENHIPWEKGVTDLKCDLKTQTVQVTYKTSKTNDDTLIAAFKKIGKEASVMPEGAKIEPVKKSSETMHDHGHDHNK